MCSALRPTSPRRSKRHTDTTRLIRRPSLPRPLRSSLTTSSAQSLDPDKVRDAIAATELDTFYGPVKFSPSGRDIAKPMVLTQVLHGKYVVVAPAKWAGEKPVIPRY
jgi:hypothetical protein